MEAEAYLQQVMTLDEMIANKRWELEQMRHTAEGMTSYSETVVINGKEYALEKVQSSGSLQPMADAVCNLVDMGGRIEATIAAWEQQKQEIITTIQALPVNEYKVLHMIYVRGMNIRDAAEKCNRSYTWGKETRRSGLQNLQIILDGRG